jgi:hypothetical protein
VKREPRWFSLGVISNFIVDLSNEHYVISCPMSHMAVQSPQRAPQCPISLLQLHDYNYSDRSFSSIEAAPYRSLDLPLTSNVHRCCISSTGLIPSLSFRWLRAGYFLRLQNFCTLFCQDIISIAAGLYRSHGQTCCALRVAADLYSLLSEWPSRALPLFYRRLQASEPSSIDLRLVQARFYSIGHFGPGCGFRSESTIASLSLPESSLKCGSFATNARSL